MWIPLDVFVESCVSVTVEAVCVGRRVRETGRFLTQLKGLLYFSLQMFFQDAFHNVMQDANTDIKY